jgi:glycine cleavage system H protein
MGKSSIEKEIMKCTDSHEWIVVEKGSGRVGITDLAQQELGEVVYVEFPEIGRRVRAGEEVAVLESTKAATDIYAPVSGTIIGVNEKLKEDVSLINRSAEEEGWLFQIRLEEVLELDALMSKEMYLHTLRSK